MRQTQKLLLFLGMSTVLLSACNNEIKSMQPLTMEEVAGTRLAQMTQEERDGAIFQYISDRLTVDKDNLISIGEKDKEAIDSLLDAVHKNLRGADNKALKEEFANYMLAEFARTPYEWKPSTVDYVGFDASTRFFFVDVTYTTTDEFKKVIPTSSIPNGSPEEEVLKQKRYSDYIYYLTTKQNNPTQAQQLLRDFESRWGRVIDIQNEQQGVSLLERTKKESQSTGGLGKLTYTGLIKESKFNTGAKMTFRYVMKYQYNLGEETNLHVDSLYLKDFELNGSEALVRELDTGDLNGAEVLKPFVDKLINSYNKAVEESNDIGLYSLHTNYGEVDKYYADISKYTYNSSGSYTYKILQRRGTNLLVEVDRVNQIRAKGSGMSLPTYSEKLIFNLVLNNDDTIRINSVNLLKSELIGEPLSVIKNVSGISDIINYSSQSFTKENESKVLEAVKSFSEVVFEGDITNEKFASLIDIGISDANLKRITDNVTAITDAKRKVTYVVSWDTKTNVFVSLKIREVFEGGTSNYDTEAVIDLVNRDGEWKVVNYNRVLNVKTSSSSVSAKNALVEHTR